MNKYLLSENTVVTVTLQTDEVSDIESELMSEGVSGWVDSSRADSRNPAEFRPFDEWWTGGGGVELRCELTRPKSILRKKRREIPEKQMSPSSVGYLTRDHRDHLPRGSASDECCRLTRERKCLADVIQRRSSSHTLSLKSRFKYRRPCTPMPLVRGRCSSLQIAEPVSATMYIHSYIHTPPHKHTNTYLCICIKRLKHDTKYASKNDQ